MTTVERRAYALGDAAFIAGMIREAERQERAESIRRKQAEKGVR